MSLFGTQLPAATASTTGFSGTWNFGGQPAAPTTTTMQQQPTLTNFATPFGATASPFAASTTGSMGGFGQTQPIQPQLQPPQLPQLQQAQTTAAPPPLAGLGGARTDTNLSGTQMAGAAQSVKTPKETDVGPEIAAAVEILKQKIKENRDLAESIATGDAKMLDELDSSYRSACVDHGKALAGVQKTLQATKQLRTESRQDLLDGEMAQRLRDGFALNFDYGSPLNYLLRLATNYEKLIVAYAEELQTLENLVFGQQKPISSEDIAAHLKRVDAAFRFVTAQVYEMDKKVQELKDSFKDYRRSVYGDAAKFFTSETPSAGASSSRPQRIEGPSPFSSAYNNTLLIIANALSRAQAGAGLVPNIGIPTQQPTLGTQPFLGFGFQQQQPQPFATAQPLFRPFSTTAAAPAITTTATPFASGSLSFSSALGAPATTTVPTTTTAAALSATTTASPWRFSSSFNTSSSGTLFGGTATNVGAVKPLGLATPLQQGASAASLQLLNPPLGTKRGKS